MKKDIRTDMLKNLYCSRAGKKGRGIFTSRPIRTGAVIERCEVIFFPRREVPDMRRTQLEYYYYWWKSGSAVLPLGFGVLYNHSKHPNADWINDYRSRRMILVALRAISKDEEITVNYGLDSDEFWFSIVEDTKEKKRKKRS
ncbi:SET domain-containing protein-lysine N-methyltransferase [Candidatus Uhrbacteria bacterium]|nr:SET domain-containing protein-lysine N-methyltransferase [Candidatus Uhrbacteria bacterium]